METPLSVLELPSGAGERHRETGSPGPPLSVMGTCCSAPATVSCEKKNPEGPERDIVWKDSHLSFRVKTLNTFSVGSALLDTGPARQCI